MNRKHLGRQSVRFDFPPSILSYASVVGKKEGEGPLAAYFDQISTDTHFGQTTWEKAESQMQTLALQEALKKASLSPSSVHMLFAGDLLNQCIGTSFAARGTDIPFYGLYGACSTMAESLSLAAMAVEGGYAELAAAMTSSHFASAERQYRLPLEYGGSEPPRPSGRSLVPALFWWAPIKRRPIFAGLPPEKSWISKSPTPTTWARPWLRPLWTRCWAIFRTPA